MKRLSNEDFANLRKIRVCIQQGLTVAKIAVQLNLPRPYIYRVCHRAKLRYPKQKITQHDRKNFLELVESEGLSIRRSAVVAAIARSTAHDILKKHRAKNIDIVGGLNFESSKTWRCPRHGLVKVWPCVACRAEATRNRSE